MSRTSSRPGARKILTFAIALLITAACVRLIRAAYVDSMDFNVYWKAAQRWADQGISPYLYSASDRGFVFKYPPWILPIFLPFGFLPEVTSRVVWAIFELGCVVYSVRKLIRWGIDRRVALGVAAAFWWIWLAHFFAGQFTLVLLACALWALPEKNQPDSPSRYSTLAIVFAAKVFSLISLIGLLPRMMNRKTFLTGIGILASLHLVVFVGFWLHGDSIGLIELYRQWAHAASSGGQELGEIVIRGQMNHGFTAGVLRAFHVDARDSWVDPWVALGLGAFFSAIWWRASRGLDPLEAWSGWLGVGLIVHPLAWHHSFVLAYPLCAIALDRAIRSGDRRLIALAALGSCCIGILIPNVIGPDLVRPLELASVKSWGVCFAGAALVLARSKAVDSIQSIRVI